MNTGGVYVKQGSFVSTVHSFHHCTFQNGYLALALLVINNDQTISINEPVFPRNTWEGSWNVRKTIDIGTVNIYAATGEFSGALHEGDSYNRINWLGGSPDLIVTGYGLNNSYPVIGSSIYYTVSLRNNSATPITTSFRIGVYKNSVTQPAVGSTPDYYRTVSSLAAYSNTSVDFPAISNNTPGVWTFWCLLDYQGAISEAAEDNNIWGPRTITWQTLPPISAPVITRIAATNTIRLDWTYPYTVTRYKVYRSSDAYSGYSLVGTPSARYFEEAISANHYYYRVTAELAP